MTRQQPRRLSGYVLTMFVLLLVLPPTARAEWKEKALYSFQGGSDGAVPAGGVVFDKRGNLYGATYEGGSTNDGTVFELMPPTKPDGAWARPLGGEPVRI